MVELLTVQEVARILRVTPITVRRHIADGTLRAVRVGRGVRVRGDAIDQFVTPVRPEMPETNSPEFGGRPLTYDDPLWELVGSATDAEPTDASQKHAYLAEALAPRPQ